MFLVQFFSILFSFAVIFWLSRFIVSVYYFSYCFHRVPIYLTGNQSSSCEQRLHSCGDQTAFNLKYPFRFEDDPDFCGDHRFQLSCKHNRTVLQLNSTLYYYVVPECINYGKQTLRVLDPGLHKDDCSTLPLNPTFRYHYYNSTFYLDYATATSLCILVSCKEAVKSKSPLYVDTASCNVITAKNETSDQSESSSFSYNYAVVGKDLKASDIDENCTIYKIAPIDTQSLDSIRTGNISYPQIHSVLANGFDLWWEAPSHERRSLLCRLLRSILWFVNVIYEKLFGLLSFIKSRFGYPIDEIFFGRGLSFSTFRFVDPIDEIFFVLLMAARNVIGILLFMAFLIYKWRRRRHLSIFDTIEEFLQEENNGLMPIKYSYKEIKTMTKNFKEKLGEGGYGLVYKGKSRSGNLVAVKMLNKSKANGQDFINEVATIGRIYHVNVVRLVGFCVTNSKRALVYDYMPNGSLDKFIFLTSSNGATPLSWKKASEIAMGIARGIEYLHRGCNIQILHFDIKPHNILLDENFVPKISDFGLAKLYPVEDGYIATLTAARGTLGYMAPELFYKKIGRVSYKADVYSFGMLLMEMAGRRRNVNAHAENSSQIYFPSWIYDKMDPTEDMEIFGSNATDEEKGIVRKLILIALWCIQMAPTDRPSMREVLKMFEGDVEGMQLPPKPLLYPPDSPLLHMQNGYSSSEESTEPLCRSITLEIEQIDN